MGKRRSSRNSSIFDKKKLDDPAQLILMFEVTDLVGIVSLLYGMLLHSGAPSRQDIAPCELSVQTLTMAVSDGACRTTWRCSTSLCCRWCCSSCVPCPSSISATPASLLFSSPPSSPAATTTTPNRRILEQELSCVLLANFIEEKQLEQQQAKLAPPGQTGPSRPLQAKLAPPLSRKVRPKTDAPAADNCLSLMCRFPQEQ